LFNKENPIGLLFNKENPIGLLFMMFNATSRITTTMAPNLMGMTGYKKILINKGIHPISLSLSMTLNPNTYK
jgi:hypothetical protein